MSTKYEKIILQCVVLSIVLSRPGTVYPIIREITHVKRIILESKSEMFKYSILHVTEVNTNNSDG